MRLALAAAMLLGTGCASFFQARGLRTDNFPRTWEEPVEQQAAAAPAAAPQQAQPAAVLAAVQPRAYGLLAVLEFRNRLKGADAGTVDAGYFSNSARAAVKRSAPAMKVMTRENVLVLLQASGKTLEECLGECEVETGRKLGADLVISGDILRVGTSFKLDLRMHETKEGQLLAGVAASGKSVDELDADTARAVTELMGALK